MPIKGQLSALLPQPEIDYIYGTSDDLYMIPRRDGIMLGGTHQRGAWTMEPDPGQFGRILAGHSRLIADFRLQMDSGFDPPREARFNLKSAI